MPLVSLAALTILDAGPAGQVRAAAQAGWRSVGLRLNPLLPSDPRIVGDAAAQAELLALLDETGMGVLEIGVFPVTPDLDVAALEPVVAFGARIGARFLVSPIEDADPTRRVATFAALCDRANAHGLVALAEFNPYSACPSLLDARDLVMASGRDAGLVIDALHLSRSGGGPADLSAIEPHLLRLVHFCDAAPFDPSQRSADELRRESRSARLLPGEGALPLAALIDALPPDTPISVEGALPARRRPARGRARPSRPRGDAPPSVARRALMASALRESEAAGEVAIIFADLRARLNAPLVNLVWRELAARPAALAWTWATVRPLYGSTELARAAADLRASIAPAIAPASRPIFDTVGLNAHERGRIQAVLSTYNRANASNLPALLAALVILNGAIPGGLPRDAVPRATLKRPVAPSLAIARRSQRVDAGAGARARHAWTLAARTAGGEPLRPPRLLASLSQSHRGAVAAYACHRRSRRRGTPMSAASTSPRPHPREVRGPSCGARRR